MGTRGPRASLGRPKVTADYKRVDFDAPANPTEMAVLAKIQAMKPRERTEWLTALWAEDQQRALGQMAG